MPRICSSCQHPDRQTLDQKLRSGAVLPDLVRWTRDHPPVLSVSALSRHRADHLGVVGSVSGPRPRSTSFLADVETAAHDDLADGVLRPSIRDAIAARAEMNRQAEKMEDRDLWRRIALMLSGHSTTVALAESEARLGLTSPKLLAAGDD